MTWTLIIIIYMTRSANVEITIPKFESIIACERAGESYTANGLSSVIISKQHRCIANAG